ncbi:UNVERIFIED_CONTAM: hypothetical protein Slati_3760600 [Sesamum latifolium]|uniref:MULE transposase domain-containing protein n=1 Tax=Sesamum latifolium TaxID=2727402 RepID=A0AAW2U4H3_9LAMI
MKNKNEQTFQIKEYNPNPKCGVSYNVKNAGCRPLIGVDGCHLKGPHGGILLAAVGIDLNNNAFPIAYAVGSRKSRENWEWFLMLLRADLRIEKDYEYTFMSDKQHGLIPAFESVLPSCDNRFCVRHLHGNMKRAGFGG